MPSEKIVLNSKGEITSNLSGFVGKACLKHAAELARQFEALGIKSEITNLVHKDTSCPQSVVKEQQIIYEKRN
ncbi:MAG: hypothetical protein G01um101418_640 [Parcubacteria group bacterium Gr01-1014_18]|nr:MAG: hypothetical protein Greene041636_649 [Parcubacteria group bacterium Greene0416_36]TSC80721.1 MAG: hypothetical protein G01um101418_640 [Parcubacteria group bacterium Gr01-1014_18]TSC98668.1 MAG: hypothetical protein Greene101420_627 [Parcubacteria group bacterium Greene1014_20]TSD07172.1 MAG: hypothetical protein Greene07142_341 [Parcubacteria group bacterium Greene0714_2]